MKRLPDPRVYAPLPTNTLNKLARQVVSNGSAMQHRNSAGQLAAAIEQALCSGDDALIDGAFDEAGSPEEFRMLSQALEFALGSSRDDAGLQVRFFALPIVIVTGGQAPVSVSGVLADGAQLQALFEAHGTLGPLKTFGLSNALSSAAGLAKLKPAALYRLVRQAETGIVPMLDVPPEPIELTDIGEKAHLRFLTGVSLAPAGAPGFTETAGNIGAWGVALTRALAGQLGQPGLSLLPIPRPPMSPWRAVEAGLFAQREIGLQLFLSTALRQFRTQVGEARAAVSAAADGSVRIRLHAPFDAGPAREYVWELQRGDEMSVIVNAIYSLLEECRVMDVQSSEIVEPV